MHELFETAMHDLQKLVAALALSLRPLRAVISDGTTSPTVGSHFIGESLLEWEILFLILCERERLS